MKLTVKVKLVTGPEDERILMDTLVQANRLCDWLSDRAWETRTFSKFKLHALTYYEARERSGLSAQLVVRCTAKVADAYRLDRKTRRRFHPTGGVPFDNRILRFDPPNQRVSIWTVEGRHWLPFMARGRDLALLHGPRGESDLCLVDGAFYLFTAVEVEEPAPGDVDSFLGVDLGIKNIAVDSDGEIHAGGHVNGLRRRAHRLRKQLQAKGTKSAKRLLKRRRRKESHFTKHVNHRIAKQIVARAKGTGRGIAVEDLMGIRGRVTARKAQRRVLHGWAFADLRNKLDYKSRLAGVPLVAVDPRNTSRTCPECGLVDKRNRPSQAVFRCIGCGFSDHADHVAARNIAGRAALGCGRTRVA